MSISRRHLLRLGAGSGAALLLGACSADEGATTPSSSTTTSSTTPTASPSSASASPAASSPTATSSAIPKLSVQEAASGLEIPWGLGFVAGAVVFTERRGTLKVLRDGKVSDVQVDLSDVRAQGEGGLTGLVVDPKDPRRIIVAYNSSQGDVRLVPLLLSEDLSSAQRGEPLLTGLPANPSGRHSGCRMRYGTDGMLWVGTGDTARGTLPQDLTSLGGKTLRLDGITGRPAPDNPWISAANPQQRYVHTYGHRNVQGMALQPRTGRMYSVEHGTGVDDEVNLLRDGANYGWNPAGNSDYDETRPMTDTSIKGAVEAVWSSGDPTVASSGASFVEGAAWAGYAGCLMVACLKAEKMIALRLKSDGSLADELEVPEVTGTHGRLRTAELAPDGALWVSTANGDDDKLLRITPA